MPLQQMVDAIHWCLELGVKHISVYAFSIDNFKRSANEVGSLMHLAEEKYKELAQVSRVCVILDVFRNLFGGRTRIPVLFSACDLRLNFV